ncbi:MAG: hypothetical protein RL141_374 [Candidatus Parcubacteria bacterium]|jgi:hypothetical protein
MIIRSHPRGSALHWAWKVGIIALAILVVAGAVVFRSRLRDVYRKWTAPTLPTAEVYQTSTDRAPVGRDVNMVQGGVPWEEGASEETDTSTSGTASIPDAKLLAVPFMSQAPHANWDMPYQEACEEASILMVAAYYRGEHGVVPPDSADTQILSLVAFEEDTLRLPPDITVQQAAEVIEAQYPSLQADVIPLEGASQIKQFIATGIPVIIPADGKALPNPNFRNGGPLYHMLVVRGYTPTHFVTNDPGTRLGENFLYTYDGLLDAVHDWNGGDVPNGASVILVVRPR